MLESYRAVGNSNIVIAYTRFDLIKERLKYKAQDWQRFKSICHEHVKRIAGVDVESQFFIDSINALKGQKGDDHVMAVKSGIIELRKRCEELAAIKVNQDNYSEVKRKLPEAFVTLRTIVSSMNEKDTAPLLKQLAAAQMRFEDTYLNLAIIGDFSCGKSTFVNALFRNEILTTGTLPTTAIPTEIIWKNADNTFTITAYDHAGKSYELTTSAGKKKFEKLMGITLPDNAEKMIDAVTTDNTLCNRIGKISLVAPKNRRLRGIRMIDTPGINPGMDGTEHHVRVTQKMLREAADAAIIMFPAERVYTKEFKEFLTDNAGHLLNNSIFILTQCDRIKDSSNLTHLVNFVRGQLGIIGVKTPIIHCISAACALNVYLDDNITDLDRKWHEQFEKTISEIFSSLAVRRDQIVYSNVRAVIQKTTQIVTNEVIKKKENLETKKKTLEIYSPSNMDKECERIKEGYLASIKSLHESHVANVDNALIAGIQQCKNIASYNISIKSTKEAVSDYLKGYGTSDMRPLQSTLKEYLDLCNDEMAEKYKDYKRRLVECVNKYQIAVSASNVQALDTAQTDPINMGEIKTNVSGFMTAGSVLEGSLEYIDDIFNSVSFLEGVFQAALGVIALPFAVIGAIFNGLRSLDSIKNEAKSRINTMYDNNKATLSTQLTNAIERQYEKYIVAATETPDAMKNAYAAEYQQALNRYTDGRIMIGEQLWQQRGILKKLEEIAKAFPLIEGR